MVVRNADTLIQTNYLNIYIIYGSEFLVKQLCNLQYKDIAGNLDTIEFLLYNYLSFKINKRPIFSLVVEIYRFLRDLCVAVKINV